MNSESLRQLIDNCRHGDGRFLGVPRDWAPGKVPNPECKGYCFTEAGAWDFVARLLESGHPFEEIALNNPKGALGIVLHVKLVDGEQPLYIKIQVGSGNKAIGRSFHYSDRY